MALTNGKVNIMLNADEFKNTTQILREMAAAWSDMTDVQRAAALELLGGKRQANVLSSLLQNFQTVEDVIQSSAASSGSALKENEVYLDSMQGRIDKLTNSMQSMWVNAMDSTILKGLISIVDVLVQIVDKAGLANVAIAALMGKIAFNSKHFGVLNWFNNKKNGKTTMSATAVQGTEESKAQDADTAATERNTVATNANIEAEQRSAQASAQSAAADAKEAQETKKVVAAEMAEVSSTKAEIVEDTKEGATSTAAAAADAMEAVQDTATGAASGMNTLVGGLVAGTTAFKLFNAAATMGLSLLVGLVMQGLAKLADKLIVTSEELKEAAKQAMDTYKNAQSTLSNTKNTIKEISDDYRELAKGVDEFGNNINLSTSQYERYNEIVNQIADMFPEMVRGYTAEGNAIIKNKGNVEALTDAYKALQAEANNALLSKADDIMGNYKTTFRGKWYENGPDTDALKIKAARELEKMLENQDTYDFSWMSNYNQHSGEIDTIVKLLEDAGIGKKSFFESEDNYVKRAIKEYPNIVQSIINVWESTVNAAVSNVKPLVSAYLDTSVGYAGLTSEQKSVIDSIVSSFDEEFFNQFDGDASKMYTAIENMIQNIKTAEIDDEYALVLNTKTQFNNNDISIGDYQARIQEFIAQIDELQQQGLLSENDAKYIKISLGFELDDNGNIQDDIDSMINYAKTIIDSTLHDQIPTLNYSDLQIINSDKFNVSGVTITTWQQLQEEIRKAKAAMSEDIKAVGQAYSALAADAEKYKDINEVLNELAYDNIKISEEQYDALKELIGSEEEFADCIDTSNGYIVKNTALTKKLVDQKKKEQAADVKLAKSQACLEYYKLVKQLNNTLSASTKLDSATRASINTTLSQIDAVGQSIDKYQLLADSLLGATNAFTNFAKAQETDASNTYGDSYVEMVQTMYDALYKTGQVGTEQFQAAVKALIPEDALDGKADRMKAIFDYFNSNIAPTLTLEDDSFTLDYSSIENFVNKAREAEVLVGDVENFDLAKGMNLEKAAELMNMTTTQAYAFFAELDKYNTGSEISFLSQLDDSTEGRIIAITTQLENLNEKKLALLEGNDSGQNNDQISAINEQIKQLQLDLDNISTGAYTMWQSWTENQAALAALRKMQAQAAITGKELAPLTRDQAATFGITLDKDQTITVQEAIDKLLAQQASLEEPTVLTAQLALDAIDTKMADLQSKLDAAENDPTVLGVEADADQATIDAAKQKIQDQMQALEEDKVLLSTEFGIKLSDDKKQTLQQELNNIQAFTINDKTFYVVAEGISETTQQLQAIIDLAGNETKNIVTTPRGVRETSKDLQNVNELAKDETKIITIVTEYADSELLNTDDDLTTLKEQLREELSDVCGNLDDVLQIDGDQITLVDFPGFAQLLRDSGYQNFEIEDIFGTLFSDISSEAVNALISLIDLQVAITQLNTDEGVFLQVDYDELNGALAALGTLSDERMNIIANYQDLGINVIPAIDENGNAETDRYLASLGTMTAEPWKLMLKPDLDTKSVNIMEQEIDRLTKDRTIKFFTKFPPSGAGDANGTAHASGTAHAGGSWGASKTETALMGELGTELVVRNGRWFTVGENGASFEQVKKGDIIFNHEQTKDLLSKGYVTGRGKLQGGSALASGSAYAGLWNPADGSGSGSGSGSGGSSGNNAKDQFEEIFDWIEVRLEEINEQLDLRNARLENTTGFAKQNAVVNEMLELNKKLYDNLIAGANKYYEYSSQLLKKIPAEYREAAQDGSIAIEEFVGKTDEKTLEAIKEYREWVQKGADATQQAEEVLTEISNLAKQAIDNISNDFGNQTSLRDSKVDQLDAYNALVETKYGSESENIYKAIIAETNKNIKTLQEQRNKMQAELNAQVKAGNIKKYSQNWYDAVNDIAAVDTEIINLTADTYNYQDSINELHWDHLDNLLSRFEAISDEVDNLIDILGSKDLVDETGNWTKEGITSLGLYVQKMEVAEMQAKKYKDEINYLNKNWKKLGYTEQEYVEKLEELKQGQYDAIKTYNDTKDAIVDLNKERIDAIKDGIQKEIDAYEELINKKKEELDADKDAHDWQKTVAEKQKNISDIERKIAALSADNSASARAQRAKLEAELIEAQAELQETYYDRSITDQQNALDKELENFKENKDKEMEGWDEYLENTEQVVADSLSTVQTNTDAVYQTLKSMGKEYSLSIAESLTSPWKDGETAIQSFSEKFGLSMSSTVEELQRLSDEFKKVMDEIEGYGSKVVDQVDKNEKTYQGNVNAPENSKPGNNTPQQDNGQKEIKTIKVGGKINAGSAKIYSYAGDKTGEKQYYSADPIYTVLGINGEWVQVRHKSLKSGVTGWFKKSDIKAYATGTAGVSKDQLALIDELGEELQLVPDGNGRLAYLRKGTAIIPHDISENLMQLGQLNPQDILDRNRPTINAPHITNNETVINIEYGDVLHIENFNGDKPEDLSKMIDKAFDKHMKDLNQQIRRYAR